TGVQTCSLPTSADVAARLYVQGITFDNRNISPPIPRRDAALCRNVVEAVDRAALVAAGDDDCLFDPRIGPCEYLHDERLPLAAHVAHVELACGDQLIDERALADRAGHEDDLAIRSSLGVQLRSNACHTFDVRLQIASRANDAREVTDI